MRKVKQLRIVSLQADGRQVARGATLWLGRDYPEPGLPGQTDWSVTGRAGEPGELAVDTQLAMTLGGGRVVQGHAFLANQSFRSGVGSTFEYHGTDQLEGADSDFP